MNDTRAAWGDDRSPPPSYSDIDDTTVPPLTPDPTRCRQALVARGGEWGGHGLLLFLVLACCRGAELGYDGWHIPLPFGVVFMLGIPEYPGAWVDREAS